jgi:hypothetical protein
MSRFRDSYSALRRIDETRRGKMARIVWHAPGEIMTPRQAHRSFPVGEYLAVQEEEMRKHTPHMLDNKIDLRCSAREESQTRVQISKRLRIPGIS